MYKFLREQVEEIKTKELSDDLPIDSIIDNDTAEEIVIGDELDNYDANKLESEIETDTEEKLDEEIKTASSEKEGLTGGDL